MGATMIVGLASTKKFREGARSVATLEGTTRADERRTATRRVLAISEMSFLTGTRNGGLLIRTQDRMTSIAGEVGTTANTKTIEVEITGAEALEVPTKTRDVVESSTAR